MGDIKSAREIAMEKLEQLGEPTEEERLKWKYEPKGQELAAQFLKENSITTVEVSCDVTKYNGANYIAISSFSEPFGGGDDDDDEEEEE